MSQNITAPEYLIKQPNEKRQYTMDFSNLMAAGELIEESSPAPSVSFEDRGGGGSTDLTITGVEVSGQNVNMWISGGIHARTYRVEVLIETNGGQILEGDGKLKVTDKR
jgi:hypothetical protein